LPPSLPSVSATDPSITIAVASRLADDALRVGHVP